MSSAHDCAEVFDVAVIGAGPAGGAAAITLARGGRRTLLIERSVSARPRPIETLASGVRPLLALLGATHVLAGQGARLCSGIVSAWSSPSPGPSTSPRDDPWGGAVHVERARFDTALAQTARALGASLRLGTRVARAWREHDRWCLALHDNARAYTTAWAHHLIVAVGRASWPLMAPNAPRRRLDAALALVAQTLPSDAPVRDASLLVEACRAGWCYSAPGPDDRLTAVLVSDPDLLDLHDAAARQSSLMNQLPAATRARLAGWPAIERVDLLPAHVERRAPSCGEGWLAIGDAAWACDPLSGRGVERALSAGLAAGEWLLHAPLTSPQLRAWQALDEHVFRLFLHERQAQYASAARFMDAPFWRRRCRPAVA